MATVKKGTLTASPEWWRHLRCYNKRRVAKAERKASEKEIEKQTDTETASEAAERMIDDDNPFNGGW